MNNEFNWIARSFVLSNKIKSLFWFNLRIPIENLF